MVIRDRKRTLFSQTAPPAGRPCLTRPRPASRGSLTAELIVAMAVLMIAIFPLIYSFAAEQKMLRACYQRALATEIVDGEMEVLKAGQWRAWEPGSHPYLVQADAATNLPPGHFILTLTTNRLRLEWRPTAKTSGRGSAVAREATLP